MGRQTQDTPRPPTMHDVARLAGVSQTTVSFVVNNTPNTNIPEPTRNRILAAIEKLGYRPNASAKSLRMRQSQIIGFVTDEIATSSHAGQVIQGAQDAAAAAGKVLLLANTGGDPDVEKAAIETMLEHRVSSLIYATMWHRVVEPPASLRELPSVLLDCYCEDRLWPSVVPEEVNSAQTAINIFLQKGHRRIGFINSVDVGPAVRGRLEGYKRALAACETPFTEDLLCAEESSADGGYRGTIRLMSLTVPPTAIFCFNDLIAMGVYEALNELNLNIPQHVAVIGFDNLEIIAASLRPKLSTMELPHYEMGRWAVNYLLDHAEDKDNLPPVQHTIACPYIERDSV